jgi:hypothetical protein
VRPGRVAVVASVVVVLATSGCGRTGSGTPFCENLGAVVLVAQSVPSALLLPCVQSPDLLPGWSIDESLSETGSTELWLSSDRAGIRSVSVTLAAECEPKGTVGETGRVEGVPVTTYEQIVRVAPYAGYRYEVFDGGCVTFQFSFGPGATYREAVEATDLMGFRARQEVSEILADDGLTLCGAGTTCPD